MGKPLARDRQLLPQTAADTGSGKAWQEYNSVQREGLIYLTIVNDSPQATPRK